MAGEPNVIYADGQPYYRLTSEDKLWLARMMAGEGADLRDRKAQLWTIAQRFVFRAKRYEQTITELASSSYFSSADSFAMIRGGHIDLSILGAMEVAENGDLANWMIPGKMVKGMGGAMDLVAGVKRVVVIMEHNAKDGAAKLVNECDLPMTGLGVVDLVITDLGVFEITPAGMQLTELADGVTLEEITAKTQAPFTVALAQKVA